ncbi:MAG: hypothetical protein R3Y38_06880 [Rikenellaceae bacterium]
MNTSQENLINVFASLGERLRVPDMRVVSLAQQENPWYTEKNILYALDAICDKMLCEAKLREWISHYNIGEPRGKRVGIIMAANLPLVGFADLLYVLFSGAIAVVKPSSRDRVLMGYVIDLLREIEPEIKIEFLDDNTALDALIATGSDNANRYFRQKYGDIPKLLRGTMFSFARLDNSVSDSELALLTDDVFLHNSLGCRSVSHLAVSKDFDLLKLIKIFAQREEAQSEGYINNYKQNKAIKTLMREDFLDGGFFTLTLGEPDKNLYISNITYSFSDNFEPEKVQCEVSREGVYFGCAQRPELSDYADKEDVMDFLIKNI